MIQNVRYEKHGLRAAVFNYGNVVVQTAGTGEFTFDKIRDPRAVQKKIFERVAAFKKAQSEREAARRREEMGDWFSVYKELDAGAGPKRESLPGQLYSSSELHRLFDILFIAVCAAVCGADTWAEVEGFGYAKLNWLQTLLELPNGIPDRNAFWRVFARLRPDQFQSYFMNGAGTVLPGSNVLDGSAAGHSRARTSGQVGIRALSAWAAANRLVVGQIRDGEASNEEVALPDLWSVLDLADCVVATNAKGLWRAVADDSRGQGGDYVLTLAEEHGRIYEDVKKLFQHCQRTGYDGIAHDHHKTVDEHRGQIEIRQCWAVAEPEYLRYLRQVVNRQDLKSVAMVVAERYTGDLRSTETRWYISSLPCDPKQLLYCVRGSWSVVPSSHWLLDIVVGRDGGRIHEEDGPPDFGVLRDIADVLLKQERAVGGDIESKRLKAASSEDYLLRVLTASDEGTLLGL